MMNVNEFLKMLRTAHDVPNYYCNKPPKNLGYFDGKKYSFDCWNLIKVVLAGWQPTGVVGSKGSTSVTGDVDGATLLKNCTNRSKDFSKISVPGTYLYLSTNPHAGVFIGEFQNGGKTYNVVECTKNMYAGQDGVTYSYVDKDGTRRPYAGGPSKGKWTDYGLLTKWVTYGDIPAPAPTVRDLQKGCQGEDVKKAQKALLDKGFDPQGVDGIFGNNTDKATKNFQAANGLVKDGIIGPKTREKLYSDNSQSNSPNQNTDSATYYTVKPGDTLSGIAKKCKVKVSTIIELNPDIKDPDKIYTGQKIRIS